ncbi:MAG: DNA-binding LacI/PurR family transcriptional regulator [Oceanospirillaceae bacterium]
MKNKAKSITAQDVADLAGVSRAAVSRTFSKRGSVAPATRQKVLDAAKTLGYQVNILAQSLNRQRSDLVGLVTTTIRDPFRSLLLEHLIKQIQLAGYQALVTEVESAEDLEQTLQKFIQFRVSGVIITSGRPPAEFAKECVRCEIPVVVINRETDLANADVVKSDNSMGAELAAKCLLDANCKNIAYLNVENDTYSSSARGAAFLKAIAQDIVDSRVSFEQIVAQYPRYEGGVKVAKKVFADGCKYDGIFCANDLLACGFIDGARSAYNLKAPKDFCIVGFDDIPVAEFESYQLTTIRQNAAGIARQALALLKQRAADNSKVQVVEDIAVELITRSTVRRRS